MLSIFARELLAKGEARGEARGEAKGEARGFMEGEARGKARGLLEGIAAVLLRQMQHQFGPLPAWVQARVEAAELVELESWTTRILAARTLEEVFDGSTPANTH
ncbi:MAG: hypothetical protein HQL95_01320 [Magnetococcales bacterium]|nr:hypothetical protein [Magnetococcales bacterium]